MGIYCTLLCVMIGSKGICSTNIALGKPAVQSSVTLGGTADLAVDGNSNSNFHQGSCIHTLHYETDQWWMVDLQNVYNITDVWIQNRNTKWSFAFHDFSVEVYRKNPFTCEDVPTVCDTHPGTADPGENVHMTCRKETIGRYMRVLKLKEFLYDDRNDILIFCEVEVHGELILQPPTEVHTYGKRNLGKTASDSVITLVTTEIECARMCSHDNSCCGINVHPVDGGCQLVTDFFANLSLTDDQEWNFYPRC